MAIVNGLAQVVLDIEHYRTQQRDQREAAIREAADRQSIGIGRLRGHLPASAGIFGESAASAGAAPAQMTRGQAFDLLRAGGSRAAVSAEHLADFEVSRSALGWG